MKKKTALVALALILCTVNVAFAANFIMVSNRISEDTPVSRTELIKITVDDFPDGINFGINYTFAVTTESLADQELTGLVSYITIQYLDGDSVPIDLTSYFYIYYNDNYPVEGYPDGWEGPIQDTFAWNGTHLVSTAMGGGSWDAPIGYINIAEVTFSILADAPLPDGTLTWEAWVEAPLLE